MWSTILSDPMGESQVICEGTRHECFQTYLTEVRNRSRKQVVAHSGYFYEFMDGTTLMIIKNYDQIKDWDRS